MTALNNLSATQRTILRILDERTGASVQFFQRTLRGRDFSTTMAPHSIRRAISQLRTAGYDIAFGETTSACSGRKLYSWVKSPVASQAVAVGSDKGTEW